MGFYVTNGLGASVCECPEKTHPPSKNRVVGSRRFPAARARRSTPQTLEPHREKQPTTTTTASGVHYYGYRYYNPDLGRWVNRDPIKERGGLNVYGFVGNNPLNKQDPTGLSSQPQEGGECNPCAKCTFQFFIRDDGSTVLKAKGVTQFLFGDPKGNCHILSRKWFVCTWLDDDLNDNEREGTGNDMGWRPQEKLDDEFLNENNSYGGNNLVVEAKIEYLSCENFIWVKHWSTRATANFYRTSNQYSFTVNATMNGASQ